MRNALLVLLLAALAGALTGSPAGAAPAAAPAHARPASLPASVLEWFSSIHPKPGQTDTVFVRVFLKNKPLVGATMSASVQQNKRVIAVLRGTTTDAHGQARARFRIPKVKKGTALTVLVSLRYKGQTVIGNDTLWVGK